MRFRGLDLNLLVAFSALLETRSVSRAAEQMNLSQPAMSAALARLRDYFGDPILVANGKKMFPTAYAEALLPQVRAALGGIDALISSSTSFDPATSKRIFRIAASDYLMAAVLVPLIQRLSKVAPEVRIENLAPTDDSYAQLDEGKLDLLITPEGFIGPEHPAELLFEEQHVIVGWNRNPLLGRGRMSEDDFYESGHIAVAFGSRRTFSFADRHIEQIGRPRRIETVAASFTVVPWLVQDTMRVALMHERLFRAMRPRFSIAASPIPFDFPTIREMVQYNRARASDEGLTWLRGQLHRMSDPIHQAN